MGMAGSSAARSLGRLPLVSFGANADGCSSARRTVLLGFSPVQSLAGPECGDQFRGGATVLLAMPA